MTLLQILPPSSPQLERIRQSLQRLKPRIEAAQKRETAEMMDKLKGLGNSLLSARNVRLSPNYLTNLLFQIDLVYRLTTSSSNLTAKEVTL